MKKLLAFLIFNYVFALGAEVPSSLDAFDVEDLQLIFEKDYLHAEDNLLLSLYANQVVEENNSSLKPSELIKQFQALALTPDIQRKYLSIYASHFKPEETEKVCELMQNELYLSYRQQIAFANYQCHLETIKILQELAQASPKSSLARIPQPILHLTKENKRELFHTHQFLIVDIYTDWCGPCKYLSLTIEELNEEYGHLYQFVKLNAEQEEALAKSFKIKGFPTILFIKDGKEIGRQVGFMSKEKFVAKMKSYFE